MGKLINSAIWLTTIGIIIYGAYCAFIFLDQKIKEDTDQTFCGDVKQIVEIDTRPSKYKILITNGTQQHTDFTYGEDTPFVGQNICIKY